jgi:hypothetical protein
MEYKEKSNKFFSKTFFMTGAYLIGGGLLFIVCIFTKVFYNSYESRIDYNKLFIVLLVLFCIGNHLIKKD